MLHIVRLPRRQRGGLQKVNSYTTDTEIHKELCVGAAALGGIAHSFLAPILACQGKSRQLDSDLCVLVYERIRTMKATEGQVTWAVQNHRVLKGEHQVNSQECSQGSSHILRSGNVDTHPNRSHQ